MLKRNSILYLGLGGGPPGPGGGPQGGWPPGPGGRPRAEDLPDPADGSRAADLPDPAADPKAAGYCSPGIRDKCGISANQLSYYDFASAYPYPFSFMICCIDRICTCCLPAFPFRAWNFRYCSRRSAHLLC